jgi:hypothetical protein
MDIAIAGSMNASSKGVIGCVGRGPQCTALPGAYKH